jgi:hypothetical protein
VNARELIITALAGKGASTGTEAADVLGIALEFLAAEAHAFLDGTDATHPDYSLAAAHLARCDALKAFVDHHLEVSFAEAEPASGVAP